MFLRKAQRRCAVLPEGERGRAAFFSSRQAALPEDSFGVAVSAPRGKDELSSSQVTLSTDSLPGLCLTGKEQLHSFWWSLHMGVECILWR